MDIFEEIEQIIRQTKYLTLGYSHSEIFEILFRKIDILETEKRNEKEGTPWKKDTSF